MFEEFNAYRRHLPSRRPHRRLAGCSERLPHDQRYGKCGENGIPRTADVADFRGNYGEMPDGAGSFGTDHSAAAEGDDNVAAVSVGRACQLITRQSKFEFRPLNRSQPVRQNLLLRNGQERAVPGLPDDHIVVVNGHRGVEVAQRRLFPEKSIEQDHLGIGVRP